MTNGIIEVKKDKLGNFIVMSKNKNLLEEVLKISDVQANKKTIFYYVKVCKWASKFKSGRYVQRVVDNCKKNNVKVIMS